jgi:hypothetical protein
MSARRLHAVCPQCPYGSLAARTHPLRPDGCIVQHTHRGFSGAQVRCDGSGLRPAPESVRAWLTTYETEAIERMFLAREALTKAEADLTAATAEREERAAWCAKMTAKLNGGVR